MKDVILIGAGHTHVQVLRQHAMKPFDATLTLVVDDPIAVYSGMVPGLVAGQYEAHELEIDARPLGRRAGARVIHGRASRVDTEAGVVHIDGRVPLRYDIASINIGSTVAGLDTPGVREFALPTRPISQLVQRIDARLDALGPTPEVVVVGAGAGGVELAFCLEARIRARGSDPTVHLVFSSEMPLPDRHPRIAEKVITAAQKRGIHLHPAQRATAVLEKGVELSNGQTLPSDLTVWVAGATGLPLGRTSGLPTDDRGFIQVADTLRVPGSHVFAAGDCAVLESWPTIPKAGVYAVRQGPVLADNLRAMIRGQALKPYVPQRDFFSLLNLGDGTAIGAKWGVPVAGPPMMRWKDHIDRLFMNKFQVLAVDGTPHVPFLKGMPPMPEMEMVCGGCAAKVGQTPLSRALARLDPPPEDPSVRLGIAQADDVVAWEHDGVQTVQNLDAFTAFTDDPYVVGQAAAHNATSDLWCRGVRPRYAMATVTVPGDDHTEEVLFQVMAGVRAALDADGVSLLGGHSTVGEMVMVGLAVTGHGPARWPLGGAKPGDTLLLTRPLGTGVLFHADMAGRAPGPAMASALKGMQRGNGPASRALEGCALSAVTDVTGFGLAGHLAELTGAAEVSATISVNALPVLDGVAALLAQGERSTFHDQTRDIFKALRIHSDAARHPHFEVLFDPQTVGGLLIATSDPDAVEAAVPAARRIGHITPLREDGAPFEVLP